MSFLIDFVIIFILSTIAFESAGALIENSANYKKAHDDVVLEIDYYDKDYIAPTGLVEFVKDEHGDYVLDNSGSAIKLSEDEITEKYICKSIVRSFEEFGNAQQSQFVLNEDVQKYGSLSVSNDHLANFYINYLPTSGLNDNNEVVNMNGKTPSQYLFALYTKTFENCTSIFATFDGTKDLPVLNTISAYQLMTFMYGDKESSDGKNGSDIYTQIITGYSHMLEEALEKMLYAEPYYSNHYVPYMKATNYLGTAMNLTLIISIIACSLLYIIISKLIFKDGTTVGRRLISLGVVRTSSEKTPIWLSILLSIIEGIGFLSVSVFIYLMPPFAGSYRALIMPLGYNGLISFGLILVIVVILGVINAISSLFTHRRQTLLDMASKTVVVDTKTTDEIDEDTVDEATVD